jgi:hypothetical protein
MNRPAFNLTDCIGIRLLKPFDEVRRFVFSLAFSAKVVIEVDERRDAELDDKLLGFLRAASYLPIVFALWRIAERFHAGLASVIVDE